MIFFRKALLRNICRSRTIKTCYRVSKNINKNQFKTNALYAWLTLLNKINVEKQYVTIFFITFVLNNGLKRMKIALFVELN